MKTLLLQSVLIMGMAGFSTCDQINQPAPVNQAEVQTNQNSDEANPAVVQTPEPQARDQKALDGKYGCTASKYRNGEYEFIPRGSFTITATKYVYHGFEKPSTGTVRVDEQGNLHFSGGYFDQGKAEKTDRENTYLLVFPGIPDNRWTCKRIVE